MILIAVKWFNKLYLYLNFKDTFCTHFFSLRATEKKKLILVHPNLIKKKFGFVYLC